MSGKAERTGKKGYAKGESGRTCDSCGNQSERPKHKHKAGPGSAKKKQKTLHKPPDKPSDGTASNPLASEHRLAGFRDLSPDLTGIVNSGLTREERLRLSRIDWLSYRQNVGQAEMNRITKFMSELQCVPQQIADNLSGRGPSRLQLPLFTRVALATGYAKGFTVWLEASHTFSGNAEIQVKLELYLLQQDKEQKEHKEVLVETLYKFPSQNFDYIVGPAYYTEYKSRTLDQQDLRICREYVQQQANILVTPETAQWLESKVLVDGRWAGRYRLVHLDPAAKADVAKCLEVKFAQRTWVSIEPPHPHLPPRLEQYDLPKETHPQAKVVIQKLQPSLKIRQTDVSKEFWLEIFNTHFAHLLESKKIEGRREAKLCVTIANDTHTVSVSLGLKLAVPDKPHFFYQDVLAAMRVLDPWKVEDVRAYIEGHVRLFAGQGTVDWLSGMYSVPSRAPLKEYLDPTQCERQENGIARSQIGHCPVLASLDPPGGAPHPIIGIKPPAAGAPAYQQGDDTVYVPDSDDEMKY